MRVPIVIPMVLFVGCAKPTPSDPLHRHSTSAPAVSAASAAPPASTAQPPPPPLLDLLYATKAAIAVSSSVDNPKDFPEHLIDYKKDTAWNGKTGDLSGWIAFRVPKDAWVARVEITPGFDKVAKDGTDLFTANHRIKRVRVVRDGQPIGEHTLDVARREAQQIPIGKDGGEFKIEILETVPGTKKEWRELVVSELHVMGNPARIERENGEQPRVFVGTLDAPKPQTTAGKTWAERFYPSIEAMCATQKAEVAPGLAAASKEVSAFRGEMKLRPECERSPLKLKPAPALEGPFLDLATISYETGYSTSTRFVLRTTSGWRVTEKLPGRSSVHIDTGCPVNHFEETVTSIKTLSSSSPEPRLVVVDDATIFEAHGLIHTRRVKTCRLDNELLACTDPIAINEAYLEGEAYALGGETDFKYGWGADTPYTIEPDGKVKLAKKFVSTMESILDGRRAMMRGAGQ